MNHPSSILFRNNQIDADSVQKLEGADTTADALGMPAENHGRYQI